MENLKYTLSSVNDWIKTADQKAMILGSFNIASFVYQLVNLDKLNNGGLYIIILFILSIIITAFTLFFWLRIIYPRLDNKNKKSKIFFQHIANAYEEDIDTGIEELQNFDDKKFKRDLASQIIINSIIAKKKYADTQKFIWLFGFQFIILIFFYINML